MMAAMVPLSRTAKMEYKARTRNNGFISSKKGVNLPNTDVDLPALSEKDKNDLRFGVRNNVDMVFACKSLETPLPPQFPRLSHRTIAFIRKAQDIKDIRSILGKDGAHIQIIAKIENRQGLNNFPEILAETDGVMVARGDVSSRSSDIQEQPQRYSLLINATEALFANRTIARHRDPSG